jgi:hypothetical protein
MQKGTICGYEKEKLPNPSLVDNGSSFDTPGVPGGVQVSDEKKIFDFSLCARGHQGRGGYEGPLYLIRGHSNQRLEIKRRGCWSKAGVIESANQPESIWKHLHCKSV